MLINLSEILSNQAKTEHHECEISMKDFEYSGMHYPIVYKSPVVLDIESAGKKKVHAVGEFTVHMLIPCDRCLEDVKKEFHITFDKVLDFSDSEDDEEENLNEMSFVEGSELDVDVLVYDELVMAMPMKVLCKPDCKGICPVCGADRNVEDCGCDTKVPDPRMAAIRDIFNKSKEV